MKFRTVIHIDGKNTAIIVPDEVVASFGPGKRHKLVVTLNGYSYRSSVSPFKGQNMISLSAENCAKSGVAGGDVLEVQLELDDAPRVVELPADVAERFAEDHVARTAYETLSFSRQRALIDPISQAKTEATRAKRVDKVFETLHADD